jgi:uncharacterized protein (TIGR03382 family)
MRASRMYAVCALAGLGALLSAAGPARASSISMTWISTSGAGVGVGTPTLSGVGIGDTLVLQIDVNASVEGVSAVGVTFQYDPSVLAVAATQRCPAAGIGNPFGDDVCGSDVFSGLLTFNADAVNTTTWPGPGPAGVVGGIQVDGGPPSGQADTTFSFAHITFTAIGVGATGDVFFRPGVDGLITTANEFLIPPATGAFVGMIPEPDSAALLGLGLLALAWQAGRRRGAAL